MYILLNEIVDWNANVINQLNFIREHDNLLSLLFE